MPGSLDLRRSPASFEVEPGIFVISAPISFRLVGAFSCVLAHLRPYFANIPAFDAREVRRHILASIGSTFAANRDDDQLAINLGDVSAAPIRQGHGVTGLHDSSTWITLAVRLPVGLVQ